MIPTLETREPFLPEYQVPAIEKLSDNAGIFQELPGAPVLLTWTPGALTWRKGDEATGYRVEKRTGLNWESLATLGDVASYTNANITSSAWYRVRSINDSGIGGVSNTVFIEE